MKLFKFLKKKWKSQDDFDKFFSTSLLFMIVISAFIGIFFPWIFDNFLIWSSETFSVPLVQERLFQLDAQGILFITLVLIIFLLNGAYELVRGLVKKKKNKKKN